MKRIKYLVLKSILITFFLLSIKFGNSQNANKSLVSAKDTLDEVTVTATRLKTSVKTVPYSTNTLSAREIFKYQFRTAPEALYGLTGIFIQKTNHGGGSPFVRGLTGNQLLYMVDGVRINNSTFRYGPNQYLNTIDIYSIASIEVLRGSGSVQYGSDAMGGVVQLFTKQPEFNSLKKLKVNALTKVISNNMEYSNHAEVFFGSPKLAFYIGSSLRQFGDLYGGDTTGKQSPSGYKEYSINGKLKYKLNETTQVTLSSQFLKQSDVPLYHKVKLENYSFYNFAPQQKQISYLRYDKLTKRPLVNKISFLFSLQNSLENRSYKKNNGLYAFHEIDRVITQGLSFEIESKLTKKISNNFGVDLYRDKVLSQKIQQHLVNNISLSQRGLYPNNAININSSLFALQHVNLKKFKIESGLRYNYYKISISDTFSGAADKKPIQISSSSLVGNMGIVYNLGLFNKIYASANKCYRLPNIDDMGTIGLVDFRYEIPSYNLSPEKTTNLALGYRFANKFIEAGLEIFHMQLVDLITRVQVQGQKIDGNNVYRKENSQSSFIRGMEGTIGVMFSKNFTLKVNGSYCYGQNTSKNEPMRRIPPLNGRGLLVYQKKNFEFILENCFTFKQNRLAQGDKDDNRIPIGGTPGWNITNLYFALESKSWNVNLGFLNLFNKDYRTHGSGINGMGRSASLTVQYQISK